jgi:hypothetical protein
LLAQAQKHGQLAHFQTWNNFYEYPRKGHAKHIKKFTAVLAELKQRNTTLEDIEVLKAWDKRHFLRPLKKPVKPAKKSIPVDWARNDSYLPAIAERVGQLSSSLGLRFVGASQSRSPSPRKVVFLTPGWSADLTGFRNVALSEWTLPWIGLSWSLRQDVPLAAAVVRDLVGNVRLCA